MKTVSVKEQSRIRAIVYRAVKSGKLVRPEKCEQCGTKGSQIEGHHEDYTKPLEVIWLCKQCHKETMNLSKGSDQHNAKLTEDDVKTIRSKATRKWGSQARLADEFGVSQATISNILKYKSWRHVP